jgi:hypothetical protein
VCAPYWELRGLLVATKLGLKASILNPLKKSDTRNQKDKKQGAKNYKEGFQTLF